MSSLPQHFYITIAGKGGCAVSFYMRLVKRNIYESRSASNRRVRKLSVITCSWCSRSRTYHLCACLYSCVNWASNLQHHPLRVVTTSLRYRSEFPSLCTPMARSRASKQLSDAAFFFGSDLNGSTNTIFLFACHVYLSPPNNKLEIFEISLVNQTF